MVSTAQPSGVSTFPLAVQSPLFDAVAPRCLAASSCSAAAVQPVSCGRTPGTGELTRPAFRAGFFASPRVLQQPRMQYAQKFSSFHAVVVGSVALHCSSSAHSLSSTQHALCSSNPD